MTRFFIDTRLLLLAALAGLLLCAGQVEAKKKKGMGQTCGGGGDCRSGFCRVDVEGTPRCMPRDNGKRAEPCVGDSQCGGGLVCNRDKCGNKPPAICGDGKVEGLEECDDGSGNSDLAADACRTDCTRASCGDNVEDRGEACDEGYANSDQIPNACRKQCKAASCGDGVIDDGEECDGGAGCHACRRCEVPRDGLTISGDTRLCAGSYSLEDRGSAGLIEARGSDYVIDCRGAELQGKGMSRAAPKLRARLARGKRGAAAASPGAGRGATTPAAARRGTAFVVKGDNITLLGCRIAGFATAIDLRGATDAAVIDSELCDNNTGIQTGKNGGHGAKNRCAAAGEWHEGGKAGCTRSCR